MEMKVVGWYYYLDNVGGMKMDDLEGVVCLRCCEVRCIVNLYLLKVYYYFEKEFVFGMGVGKKLTDLVMSVEEEEIVFDDFLKNL